jgi:hypothetical protein
LTSSSRITTRSTPGSAGSRTKPSRLIGAHHLRIRQRRAEQNIGALYESGGDVAIFTTDVPHFGRIAAQRASL